MKPFSKTIVVVKRHVSSILFPILYTLILFLIAVAIYFYANGYRLNIFNREITQTGVVSIESEPFGSDVYQNNQLIGKTPKSTSLLVGDYNFTIKRDGYYDWSKNISILEGKSTPLTPWLVKQNPASNVVWTSTGEVENYWINSKQTHVILLINDSTQYSLWEYTLNPALWDFSSNPTLIMELDNNDIEIMISPDGELAILTIATDSTSQYYLISTLNTNTLLTLQPLPQDVTEDYILSWSLDGSHLIGESESKIISYNTQLKTTYTLVDKAKGQKYIWSTDDQGYFYIVENTTQTTDSTYSYRLKQVKLDGTGSKYMIDSFYFQKTDEYITQYRTNGYPYSEFSTSPESTYSAGLLDYLYVNQEAQGVLFRTDLATYWFSMDDQKFMMISAYPATLISFSEDQEKLIFQDEQAIGIFTFEKTQGDHTTDIGSKTIKNITDFSKVSNEIWISNSLYIAYLENNAIYIADKDGDNKDLITQPTNLLTFLVTESRSTLVTFTKNTENKLEITNFIIH